MKHISLRSTLCAAILVGGAVIGASAFADPDQGSYGYGMGPGMMGGGYGAGYGMGPGMMGYGWRADLNLTSEQRGKIAKIENDVRRKHWELMGRCRTSNP